MLEFKEHSVMYPVDLLKVCIESCDRGSRGGYFWVLTLVAIC